MSLLPCFVAFWALMAFLGPSGVQWCKLPQHSVGHLRLLDESHQPAAMLT